MTKDTSNLMQEFEKGIGYNKPKLLGGGAHGDVYRISDTHVAKLKRKHYSDDIISLEHELDITTILFENNINVPKPEGIFKVKLNRNSRYKPAFVMEYIEGKTLLEISERAHNKIFFKNRALKKYNNLKDLTNKELQKVIDLGIFEINDSASYNRIWCPEREKIYLIDFVVWKKKEN